MGSFSFDGLKELQARLGRIQQEDIDALCEQCAKELAGRLLKLVVPRTPIGEYGEFVEFDANLPAEHVSFNTKAGKHVEFDTHARTKHVRFPAKTGKEGGTLRRGWTVSEVRKEGDTYKIDIINPVKYASYVEYGHLTANHRGWVPGRFMLTYSEKDLQSITPQVLERRLTRFLKEHWND